MRVFKSLLERSTQIRNEEGEVYIQTFKPILLRNGYKMLVAKYLNSTKYRHIIFMDDRGAIRCSISDMRRNPIPEYRKVLIRNLDKCKL